MPCKYLRQHLNSLDAACDQAVAKDRCHRRWQAGRWTLLVLSVCLLTACGYSLAGPGQLPGGVQTIAVEVFTNRSAESGLETTLTNAVIDEMTRRRQDLVVGLNEADAVLSGTIDRLSTATLSRGGTLTAVERRVIMAASFVLKDRGGKVVWQASGLSAEQAYPVGDSKAATDLNKRLAIGRVSERLAEYLFERLTGAF